MTALSPKERVLKRSRDTLLKVLKELVAAEDEHDAAIDAFNESPTDVDCGPWLKRAEEAHDHGVADQAMPYLSRGMGRSNYVRGSGGSYH